MAQVNRREELTKFYRDRGWNHEKVAKMSEAQVTALYLKLVQGKVR